MNTMKLNLNIDKLAKLMLCTFAVIIAAFYAIGGWPIAIGVSLISIMIQAMYVASINWEQTYHFLVRHNIIEK